MLYVIEISSDITSYVIINISLFDENTGNSLELIHFQIIIIIIIIIIIGYY